MAHDLAMPAGDGHARPAKTGSWTRSQGWALGLVSFAVLLDGVDNRLLPLAMPALARDLGLSRDILAFASFAGLLGLALGTAFGGMLGDRFGRRPTMIASMALFGLMTAVTSLVADSSPLYAVRFLAGLGIGSLLPSAAAMFSELAPARRATFMVAVGMTCMPLGSALAGLVSAVVLPVWGWQVLFMAGGGLAMATTLVLFVGLPESPGFADRKPPSRSAPAVGHPVESSLKLLFSAPYRRDTLGLWVALFAALTCLYLESQWMPTILSDAGYGAGVTSLASTCMSVGGMISCLVGVMALHRFGSRAALIGMAAAGALLILAMTRYPMNPAQPPIALMALLLLAGFLVGGLQVMLYSLGAHIYPTALRASGIGWAAGVGRLGPMLSPFLAVAAFDLSGWRSVFVLMALCLGVALIALAAIRRHLPRRAPMPA